MACITNTKRIANGFLVIVFAFSFVFLASCEKKYPEGEKPNGALSRNVTTQIDRMIALKELPVSAIASEKYKISTDSYLIKMVTVELEGVGLVSTLGDGMRIRFNEDTSVEKAEFKKGEELVKRNGWWCSAEAK